MNEHVKAPVAPRTLPRESATFDAYTLSEIRRAAAIGIYDIRGAGATAHGGLLVIEGNAAARCGISMKGVDIVVGGDIGHMSAFMGQAGRLVVLGDAGEALGDSLYEARIYVRGSVASLGADCVKKEMRPEHIVELQELLDAAGFDADPAEFTRYGSARQLYHFHVDNASAY